MPEPKSDQRIGTTFTDDEIKRMDTWGFARHIRSRAEVIRQLVQRGLEAEDHVFDSKPQTSHALR